MCCTVQRISRLCTVLVCARVLLQSAVTCYSFPPRYWPGTQVLRRLQATLKLASYFKTPVQHNKQRLTLASFRSALPRIEALRARSTTDTVMWAFVMVQI